jgi:hypothetical protein
VAGTPLKMRFRTGSGKFRFIYEPDRSIKAPTKIYVSRLHYPKGFRVAVRHGTWTREGRYLLVRASSNKKVTVRVIAKR